MNTRDQTQKKIKSSSKFSLKEKTDSDAINQGREHRSRREE